MAGAEKIQYILFYVFEFCKRDYSPIPRQAQSIHPSPIMETKYLVLWLARVFSRLFVDVRWDCFSVSNGWNFARPWITHIPGPMCTSHATSNWTLRYSPHSLGLWILKYPPQWRKRNLIKWTHEGDSLVLHCASLLRTIFASLARANERARVQNVRDFP